MRLDRRNLLLFVGTYASFQTRRFPCHRVTRLTSVTIHCAIKDRGNAPGRTSGVLLRARSNRLIEATPRLHNNNIRKDEGKEGGRDMCTTPFSQSGNTLHRDSIVIGVNKQVALATHGPWPAYHLFLLAA